MFTDFSGLTTRELEARFGIKNETFITKLQIGSHVLGDMAINRITPPAIAYQNVLIANVKGIKDLFGADSMDMATSQMRSLEKLSKHINAVNEKVYKMIDERKRANAIDDIAERAEAYNTYILPYMDSIRVHIDKLEMIIDNELWALPKYRELLFIH